jgi:hypothetical protein
MSLTIDVSRARRATWSERSAFMEALVSLAVCRFAIVMLPFRHVAAWVGLAPDDGPEPHGPAWTATLHRTGWAVRSAAARSPWSSTCLVQSLTGFVMLRRRGVAATVYLGVAKDDSGNFVAHSWLRCGDAVITGGSSQGTFSVIAVYRGREVRSP